jgi:hypothetical protein
MLIVALDPVASQPHTRLHKSSPRDTRNHIMNMKMIYNMYRYRCVRLLSISPLANAI